MSWPTVSFDNVFDIQLGKMLDVQKNAGDLLPYLANRNVQWGACDVSSLETMRFTREERTRYALRRGDLLVCEGGEVGRTAIWRGEVDDCYFQKAIHRLRPTGEVEPSFVLHYMRWAAGRNLFARLTSATSIAHLTKDKLRKLHMPLPPLAEQKRIAAILDAADALRAKRRESLAQLDTLLQSTFVDVFGDPVTNPKGWRPNRFEDLLTLVQYGPRFYNEAYTPHGIKIVRITDLDSQGNLDFASMPTLNVSQDQQEKFTLRPGDLILARTGATVGKTAIIKNGDPTCIAGAYFIRLRFSEKVSPLYAQWVMKSARVQAIIWQRSQQSAQPNFNGPAIRQLPLPIPPLDLQRHFAAIVELVEQQKAIQRSHLAELDTLFTALQSRAFRGDL